MTTTDAPVTVEQCDAEAMADAVATALARYAVAYTHATMADMSTVGRSWKVHETGHGNPFDHGVWLGEFDNKAEANAFCADLRRKAAVEAARHRLAALASAPAGAASPDHADIIETIANAADDWQKQGYPTALAEVRDMANVGRSLLERIADHSSEGPLKGWRPADCPTEVVCDLLNMLADASAPAGDGAWACRFDGIDYTTADLAIAQRAACAIVPLYGTGDHGEQEAARAGKLWNDHPAVQGALRALHEARASQARVPEALAAIEQHLTDFVDVGDTTDDHDAHEAARKGLTTIRAALARPRAAVGERYLVWSNEHQAWWGPEHRGYTRHIERAGRYDRAEAMSIAGTRDGGWHVRKGNPDEIAIPERDAVEQYAAITAALALQSPPAKATG